MPSIFTQPPASLYCELLLTKLVAVLHTHHVSLTASPVRPSFTVSLRAPVGQGVYTNEPALIVCT